MAVQTISPPEPWTVADLLQKLGNIPPQRVRLKPAPGKATAKDLAIEARAGRLCELRNFPPRPFPT